MDEALRSHEQAARAAPDDVAAGRALVRALDRTGDAARAWFERCRLARAGDDESAHELDARPRGLRAVGDVRRLEGELPLIPVGFDAHTVVVRRGGGGSGGLLGLDLLDLSTRWRADTWADPGFHREVVALGPFVIHVTGPDGLASVACASGASVARVQVPLEEPNDAGGFTPHLGEVMGARDRTLAWVEPTALSGLAPTDERARHGPEVVLIDWSAGGQVIARRARARDVRGLAGDLVLCATDAGETEALDGLDDPPVWRANGHWQTSDAVGAVLRVGHLVHEVEASTGRTRWSVPAFSTRQVVLGPEQALVLDRPQGSGVSVRALRRADGATLWELAPPADRFVGAVTLAADVVTLALQPVQGRGAPSVLALDLATGERLFERALEEDGFVELLAVERGLLVGLRTLRRSAVLEVLR